MNPINLMSKIKSKSLIYYDFYERKEYKIYQSIGDKNLETYSQWEEYVINKFKNTPLIYRKNFIRYINAKLRECDIWLSIHTSIFIPCFILFFSLGFTYIIAKYEIDNSYDTLSYTMEEKYDALKPDSTDLLYERMDKYLKAIATTYVRFKDNLFFIFDFLLMYLAAVALRIYSLNRRKYFYIDYIGIVESID